MRISLISLLTLAVSTLGAAEPPALKVLFLGDTGHHQPAARFRQLQPVFAARNIALTYTDQLGSLTPENLSKYDGLLIYANHTRISPEQEKALLDYAASGKGVIPIHCASYCFLNSPKYTELVGAQFRSHTTGVFRVQNAAPGHPVMKGFTSFESWDETYTHTKHNTKDRTVLEYRAEGDMKEPWTWVRTPGKARVFYTAWGHDERTWSHPGFLNLLERGVRWACGQDPALAGPYVDAPKMTPITGPKSDFEFVPAKVPYYPPSRTWGVNGEPRTTMQKPLSPEKSVKHYTVPEGFELKLFAADADFGGKPIAMTWDERGRLWVAVTVDYPNGMKREGEGRDKIIVLEDTDNDGRADKTTVFADKLSIPTSLLCAWGGVVVHQAPHTLFLKDTDGDGKADVRQVLFTGWGTRDTHAGPSNLRYGFDNWVYGSVGYSGFNGEVAGERHTFRQGYYRFKLEPARDKTLAVTKLEFLRSTNNNTWGLAFSEDGQLFGSTANGCPLVHLAIPNRYYEKVRGLNPGVLQSIALSNAYHPVTDKVRQVDWHGGFTAASNCAIYTARTYPKEYWNKVAFVSDPTGHLTATFCLQPAGTEYVARYGWNLAAADDEWAAPVDAQVGPDGNVWLIDWYNYIVQHNPTPRGFTTGKGAAYETPLRDKTHGRVYRLVYTKAKPVPRVDLHNAPPEKLVETLKHPNLLWRLHAQRLLVERGKQDVVPALVKLLEKRPPFNLDATGLDAEKVHVIRTLSGLGAAKTSHSPAYSAILWMIILNHPSSGVRLAALAAIPKDNVNVASAIGRAFSKGNDRVRLHALLAQSEFQSDEQAVSLAVDLFRARSSDRVLADAAVIAAVSCAEEFLMPCAIFKGEPTPIGVEAITAAARHYAAGGGGKGIEDLFRIYTNPMCNPYAREALINGLAAGALTGKKPNLNPDTEKLLLTMAPALSAPSRSKLLKLAQAWGVKGIDAQLAELTKGLFATVADPKATDAARLDAARQVIEFRPDDANAAGKLLAALTPQTSPQLAAGIFDALSQSNAKNLGPAVIAKLPALPPSARPAALRLVLARPEPTKAFLDAVEAGKLRFDMLALDQKTALAAHPDKTIAERAKKLLALGGGLPDPNRQKVIDQFAKVVLKVGDPVAGKKLFTQHCAKCHKHGGEGQQIGPDLTGMAVHPKEELLIHVLDPSRSVEGNYKSYTAKLLDGRVLTGLLAAETKTTVELLDAENKRHAVNRDDLDEFKESQKSLMPEGFEKQMAAADLTNLLEFLTQKGKYVPIPLDQVATVVSTKGMFNSEDADVERLVFKDWSPKTFRGVPFVLTDPRGDKAKNVIMLRGANGAIPPKMPRAVSLPCHTKAKAIHLLSGVGGWSYPATRSGTVSLIVRLHYADGKTEDHPLKNGVHFADYIRRVDVPGSQFAFALRGQQVRYLAVSPKRDAVIERVEFVKGRDRTAPVVMAVTVETP